MGLTEERAMVAFERFEDKNGQVVASVKHKLINGFLYCEWNNKVESTPVFYTEPESKLTYCNGPDFDYCLNDLSALGELSDEDREMVVKSFSNCLDYFSFKKISLIGLGSNNATHQKIYSVIVEKGIQVEILSTASQAIQWLLVPDHDECLWEDVPVIRF